MAPPKPTTEPPPMRRVMRFHKSPKGVVHRLECGHEIALPQQVGAWPCKESHEG